MEYMTEVNKNSNNMGRYTATINSYAIYGWRVAAAFEQDGNTITVYERGEGPEAMLLRELIATQQRTNQLLEWMGAKVPAPT
jgi:hypothetical protein